MSDLEQSAKHRLAERAYDLVFREYGARLSAGDFPPDLSPKEAAQWGCLAGAAMAIAISGDGFMDEGEAVDITDDVVPIAWAHRKGVSLEKAFKWLDLGPNNGIEEMHQSLELLLGAEGRRSDGGSGASPRRDRGGASAYQRMVGTTYSPPARKVSP
jgi:hypothetical protein